MKLFVIFVCTLYAGLIQNGSAQAIQSVTIGNQTYTLMTFQMNDYGWLTILDPTGLLSFCRMTVFTGNADEAVGCVKFININDLQSLPLANNIYG